MLKLQSKDVDDYDYDAPSSTTTGRLNFRTFSPVQIGTEFLFDTELSGELRFKVKKVTERRPSTLSTYGFGPPRASFCVQATQQNA